MLIEFEPSKSMKVNALNSLATSDSDKFKISSAADLSSSPRLTIEPGDGTVAIPGSLSVTGVATVATRLKVEKEDADVTLCIIQQKTDGANGATDVLLDLDFLKFHYRL